MYTTTAASWYVVMTLKGELVQVAPAVYPADPSSFVHACALKNYDEARLLVGTSVAGRSSGLAYKVRGSLLLRLPQYSYSYN